MLIRLKSEPTKRSPGPSTPVVTPLDRFKAVLVNIDSEEFRSISKARQIDYVDEQKIRKRDLEANESRLKEQKYDFHKELKNFLVYRKPKSPDKLFEDRIWFLMKSMGATVLNKPNSVLVLNGEGRTKQIDIIARVENIVFFIECKSSAEPTSRTMRKDFAEAHQYKPELIKLCRALWGETARAVVVFALSNVSPSEADALDAETHGIKIWDTSIVSYFEDLVDRLGNAGKYQVFAETFEEEEISDYSPRVPAIKGRSGDTEFFYFLARPADILKIAYIHHRVLKRGDHAENPYQRMVNKKRIEDIRQFVSRGRHFANDIILNLRRTPNFQNTASIEGIQYGVLTLPPYYKAAWIVDGQHRLFGYTNTIEAGNHLIPVYAFLGLSEERQGELFVDINENQRSVEPNLLWDLYSDMYFASTNDERRLLCTISLIGKELNNNKDSPLYGHIYIPSINERLPSTNITLQTVCNRLEKGTFIKRKGGKGDLFRENWEMTVDFASKRLIRFFKLVSEANEDDWNHGEDGLTRSNVGINTFMLVFQEILKVFRTYDKNPVDSEDRFERELEAVMAPAVEMVKNLDKTQILTYKQLLGEKGFAENAKRVCRVIQKKIPTFSPEILREDVEEENVGISNPSQSIDQVEIELRKLINSVLLNRQGPAYWDTDDIIPGDIKVEIKKKINDELVKHPYRNWSDYGSGEKKIQFCEIMDYPKIIISKSNWPFFEKTFRSKEVVEDKSKQLNEYRKRVKHARAGGEIDEVVKREGEASIIWFSKILGIDV